jgi:rRNA-processing protein FCF1
VCIIIDNDVVASVFSDSGAQYEEVRVRLFDNVSSPLSLVYESRLIDEYKDNPNRNVIRSLYKLAQAQRAVEVGGRKLARERQWVSQKSLKSNDDHIIALARASGARVLLSNDRDLWDDFRNNKLLSRPPGRIYRKRAHSHLLRSCQSRA